MAKLQEVNGQYTITIPRELVEMKDWKKGDTLVIGFDKFGDLVIKQVKRKNDTN